jgi:hypothetical protein
VPQSMKLLAPVEPREFKVGGKDRLSTNAGGRSKMVYHGLLNIAIHRVVNILVSRHTLQELFDLQKGISPRARLKGIVSKKDNEKK